MSVGVEIPIINNWILNKLKNDVGPGSLSALGLVNSQPVSERVFDSYAPIETKMPFIVFQPQATNDVRGVGTTRILTDSTYLIKVISVGIDFDLHKPIADRFDLLMHGVDEMLPDGEIIASVRESGFSLVEVDDGKQFRHLGGLYRIQALAT